MKLLAQGTPIGNFSGPGLLGNTDAFRTSPVVTGYLFTRVVSITIGVLTVGAGLWFILQIFIGAYQWLASGGDKQNLETAKKRLNQAIVGLFIVIFAYAIIGLVGLILGLDILDFTTIFLTLKP